MQDPEPTRYLCDNCQKEVLYQELKIKAGYTIKYCAECYNNRKTELTQTQRSLLIWLFDATVPDLFEEQHLTWKYIDQGNLITAYKEIIGGNQSFLLNRFLDDMKALIINKFVRTHTMDAFYAITKEGIAYLEENHMPITIYQCPQCGDLWSNDYPDDSLILEAHIAENPDGETIEEMCQNCIDENEKDSMFWDDPDDEHDTWDDILVYGE